jgi:predicted nuclease of restriction endonuclease-like (RecB) superfamily
LGGVPKIHQTDCLSAAVINRSGKRTFTQRYKQLATHYQLETLHINPAKAHENGKVEQSHFRFKSAVKQALIIRGHRNFESIGEYEKFLSRLCDRLNNKIKDRFLLEVPELQKLPSKKFDCRTRMEVRVSKGSTIQVFKNTYSVHSSLIGQKVRLILDSDHIEVYYGNKLIEKLTRLFGSHQKHIQYRHIIESLVKKPGAFENYIHKDCLFPTTTYRIVYDQLLKKQSGSYQKQYLRILYLSAFESEQKVEQILKQFLQKNQNITSEAVEHYLKLDDKQTTYSQPQIKEVSLDQFDCLLEEVCHEH